MWHTFQYDALLIIVCLVALLVIMMVLQSAVASLMMCCDCVLVMILSISAIIDTKVKHNSIIIIATCLRRYIGVRKKH